MFGKLGKLGKFEKFGKFGKFGNCGAFRKLGKFGKFGKLGKFGNWGEGSDCACRTDDCVIQRSPSCATAAARVAIVERSAAASGVVSWKPAALVSVATSPIAVPRSRRSRRRKIPPIFR